MRTEQNWIKELLRENIGEDKEETTATIDKNEVDFVEPNADNTDRCDVDVESKKDLNKFKQY